MWVGVNATYRQLYPLEIDLVQNCTGGWVALRSVLDGCGEFRPPLGFDPGIVQSSASCPTD